MNKLNGYINTIIWDWNGTLLNDIDICIDSINIMLSKRNLDTLTENVYRDIFTFPVKEYYIRAGFDLNKEDFDIVAMEFIDLYRDKVRGCTIHAGVREVLDYFRTKGFRQFMVSAMEHDFLIETVNMLGLQHYFDHIAGIHDHFAGSKLQQANNILTLNNLKAENTVFIGDTLHDHEVAEQAGAQTILIANGHQSADRLKQAGVCVLEDISDLMHVSVSFDCEK